VGVSGLELCLSNCSWIEHKELNLYPYDAGTDDGITYLVSLIPRRGKCAWIYARAYVESVIVVFSEPDDRSL
jgi:hypothetical protein